MSRVKPILAAICLASSLPCQGGPIRFTDVTKSAGITWVQQDFGDLIGAGAAFLDFNGDGWQDIFVLGGVGSPALYQNLRNGRFADVTHTAGLDLPSIPVNEFMAVAVGDYDNDGDPDLFITMHGPNFLMRNNGNGTFSDVTPGQLIGFFWNTAPVFHDYDRDGWLDLYLPGYVASLNFPNHSPTPNLLFHNNQDGTFTNVTELCAVGGRGTTLAVYWSDIDNDHDSDLLVGNDFGEFIEPNRVYRNDGRASETAGDVSFVEQSNLANADLQIYCMGIAGSDFDHDLDFDYYFTNIGRNVLLRNDLAAGFRDITTATGSELTFDLATSNPTLLASHWGVGFRDFDLDGWEDIYVSAGFIPAASFIANGEASTNSLLRHNGASLTFTDVSAEAGIADPRIGRGACFADFDNDGDIDILQCNLFSTPLLLRNDTPNPGNWLKLRPRGRTSNREGIGARIEVDIGSEHLLREVTRGGSFASCSELPVLFGLGTSTEIDRLKVDWPSGIENQAHHLPVNFAMPLIEPKVSITSSRSRAWTQRGGSLTLDIEIENHSQEVVTVSSFPELRYQGMQVWIDEGDELILRPAERRLLHFTLPLPSRSGGEQERMVIDAEFLWTFLDGEMGFDQFRAPLHLEL